MRLPIAIALTLVLAGCATLNCPLTPVSFVGTVSVTSNKTAKIRLVNGAIRGSGDFVVVPVGTFAVPIYRRPSLHVLFNYDDQRIFVESFRTELQRLKIVRAALDASSEGHSEFYLELIFVQTFHDSTMHKYTLDVVMEIAGGKKPFSRQYRVISSEGDSWWEKINTNASEGKAKAGKKLMQRLVPDVAAYVSENQ